MSDRVGLRARLFPAARTGLEAFALGPLRHGYEAGLEAYRGSVVAHVLWAIVFAWLGVPEYAAYQAGAALLSLGLWRWHVNGGLLGAFAVAVLEAIVQSFVAAHFIGWGAGAHVFLAPPVVITFLLAGVLWPAKVLVTLACGLSWVAGLFLYGDAVPVYALPGRTVQVIQLLNGLGAVMLVSSWSWRFSRALMAAETAARSEYERSEELLANILPAHVVSRLKAGEGEVADGFGEVTVLFADLVGFTQLAARRTPRELVALLDRLFSHIDAIAGRHGVEKIKTIGDAYMAAAGVPTIDGAPAVRMASFALELVGSLAAFDDGGAGLRLRVGLATGPAVAGVIGLQKFSYDLWGDTVNTASRMESHGEPGRIHVDRTTHDRLGAGWRFESRGTIEVKGKGPMQTWFLVGRE